MTYPQHKAARKARKRTLALSLVDDGLADLAVGEDGGGLNIVPLLAGEGVGAVRCVSSRLRARARNTYAFFLPPFLPLEIRLFLLHRR